MADTTSEREALIQEIAEKVQATTGETMDAKQEEWVRGVVRAELESGGRGYRPQPTAKDEDMLQGTTYGRLGMTLGDVEMVYDVLTAARNRDGRNKGPNATTARIVEAVREQRALDTAESGFGSQLVPDAIYVPEIWDQAREAYSRIGGLIETRTMQGPIEKHPVLAAVPDMIYVGETADAIASATAYGTQKPGSNEVTLTAKKFIAHYNYSGEMVEDSIVPFVPLLRTSAAIAQGKLMDKLALNGDTTNAGTGNINLDDADPTDTNYYLAADGIRHACLVDNTGNATNHSGAALSWEAIVKLPTLALDRTYDMHWGRPENSNDWVYVVTPELDNDILGLSEVTDAMANIGRQPEYSPLNGELARIAGNPVISTIAMGLTEADGKISTTGGNNTLGQIVGFNPRGLMWGVKRSVTFEIEREARYDMWAIIMSTRVALGRFTPTGAASGIEWATVLYNIANN